MSSVVRLLTHTPHGVLLVRRAPSESLAGLLEMPGGKADWIAKTGVFEELPVALAREVGEETALRLAGSPRHLYSLSYRSPSGKQTTAHVFACETSGQIALSSEHDTYTYWQPGTPLPENLTDTTRAALVKLSV